jgi:hypothetical protein
VPSDEISKQYAPEDQSRPPSFEFCSSPRQSCGQGQYRYISPPDSALTAYLLFQHVGFALETLTDDVMGSFQRNQMKHFYMRQKKDESKWEKFWANLSRVAVLLKAELAEEHRQI